MTRFLAICVGLLALASTLEATLPGPRLLRFKGRQFDPVTLAGSVPQAPGTRLGPGQLGVVQFQGPLQSAWRGELESLGLRFLCYVPDHGYIVRLDPSNVSGPPVLPYIRWMGRFQPELKLDPRLMSRSAGRVRVLLARDATAMDVIRLGRQLRGIRSESALRMGRILEVDLQPGELARLAGSEAVLWIEPAPQIRLWDEVATKIVGGDDGAAGTPTVVQQLGFDGSGVTVAVADSGLDLGETDGIHPDFAGRVDAFFAYGGLPDASDGHSHGTHVAGIVLGSGATGETDEFGYLYGLGVAPGAHLVVQRLFDDAGEYFAPPSFGDMTRDAVRSGAAIGSNSWGEDTQGQYDLSAAQFDALVRDADSLTPGDQPYVLEFSAGNSGPGSQTIGSPAVAKNVIATGACENNRYEFPIYGNGEDTMADFSSRGPAADGRIKPDVVAPGTWIASAKSQLAGDENAWLGISGYYIYQGGTSQSGPHVSGGAAAFVQYYREVHGDRPSPALVKAALINTAVDMGRSFLPGDDGEFEEVGDTASIPNSDEGWGRIDLSELMTGEHEFRFLDQSQALTSGEIHEQVVLVGPYDRLRVTLVYTDVEAFAGALPALVNNLDLEVMAPDGRVYRGNAFLEGESLPGTSVGDSINNVEAVHLSEPLPGDYTVRVRGVNVVEDVHRRTGIPPEQDFALVISGDLPGVGEGILFFPRAAYRAPMNAELRLIDAGLAGAVSVPVTVASTTEPDPEPVDLLPAGPNGVFTNRIGLVLSPTAGGDRLLQVSHGDSLRLIYAPPAGDAQMAEALVDLLPPVVSGVNAESEFGRMTIAWNTDEPATAQVVWGRPGVLDQVTSNAALLTRHEIQLPPVTTGETYQFMVVSADQAGNIVTNASAAFQFVGPQAATALLVFAPEQLVELPALEAYESALLQLGISYELWDLAVQEAPTAADLRPYRVVIWRPQELELGNLSMTPAMQAALARYLADGGALFMASMEVLTRLTLPADLAFRSAILRVDDFVTDGGAEALLGAEGDPVGRGIDLTLDYSLYPDLSGFIHWPDGPDHLTVSADATPIFFEPFSGAPIGLRYPRTGVDAPGRVVFCSFGLESVPEGVAPNSRAGVLGQALDFLVPGLRGLTQAAFDRNAYSVPDQAVVEITDTGRAGEGSLTAEVASSFETTTNSLTVLETVRRGIFRGSIPLRPASDPPGASYLRAGDGDRLTVRYVDPESHLALSSAVVDLVPPAITSVAADPAYNEVVVTWNTDTPTDALVRFGEGGGDDSLLSRTAYEAQFSTAHKVELTGLLPDRDYFFLVTSRDPAGNAATDNNGGTFYRVRTLRPASPPWTDDLEGGAVGWAVHEDDSIVDEDSGASLLNAGWRYGTPANPNSPAAHSGVNAYGTNLRGDYVDVGISDLISPAIDLTGASGATLRFWHFYDFTERSEFLDIEIGQVAVSTNNGAVWTVLHAIGGDAIGGWEEVELDLSRFAGHVVRIDWNYQMFSFDSFVRPGWLVDDVAVTLETSFTSDLSVTNNLAQAAFALAGPITHTASGTSWSLRNAPPGTYVVHWSPVPFYQTPPSQTNVLATNGTLRFVGEYTFLDANANDISDAWEQSTLGGVEPVHPPETDTDLDGASDIQEFLAGTDPASADSRLEVSEPIVQFNDTVRFEWESAPGREYQLEVSTDLDAWQPLSNLLRGTGGTLGVTLPPLDPRVNYFFRLRVLP